MSLFTKLRITAEVITAIIFIVLKILKVITWRWIWILSPLWAGICFSFAHLNVVVIKLLMDYAEDDIGDMGE